MKDNYFQTRKKLPESLQDGRNCNDRVDHHSSRLMLVGIIFGRVSKRHARDCPGIGVHHIYSKREKPRSAQETKKWNTSFITNSEIEGRKQEILNRLL